jgi:hypothetical protein
MKPPRAEDAQTSAKYVKGEAEPGGDFVDTDRHVELTLPFFSFSLHNLMCKKLEHVK